MSDFNPYEILGVDTTATKADIKRAYRLKSKEHHPDAGIAESSAGFVNIRKAYDLLMDDMIRAFYDATGKTDIKRADVDKAAVIILEGNLDSIMSFVINQRIDIATLDLSEAMKSMLFEQKAAIEQEINNVRKKINVVRRLSSKTKRKDGGKHIYRMIFAKKAAGLNSELNKLNMGLLASDAAIEEAKQFIDGDDVMLALGGFNASV